MRKLEEMTVLNKNIKHQIEPYSQAIVKTLHRLKEMNKLKNSSYQLLKCFELRQSIQDHEFGYLFRLPVDPYALELSDYWQKIRRPMDLKSIKHKFFLNLYKNAENFNEDMILMFGNALYYSHNNPEVFKTIKNISTHYHHEYQKMIRTISKQQQQVASIQKQLTQTQKILLNKNSSQKAMYSSLFSRKQIKQLAKCLNTLSYQKKKSMMKAFKEKNKDLIVDDQYVELQNLSGKQLFDLLNIAISYKKDDFSNMVVAKKDQHSLEGLSKKRRSEDQDQQSSFEIQDQI